MSYEKLTGRNNTELTEWAKDVLIAPQAKEELLRLQKAAKEANIHIEVASAYRSYDRQLAIWNAKASGKRILRDRRENVVDFESASDEEVLNAIMAWSAIPGASRHHWGTEVDIYDCNVKTRDNLELTVRECDRDFSSLYQWIDENLPNFSFHRPYSEDLGGVSVEPWHLSYTPLSNQFEESYTIEVFRRNIEESKMLLKKPILNRLEEFYNQYVINTAYSK
ncbi:MAG: peptidase M15 [Halobacteriovoraceae bacterium]|nr:peptidase M15 [Halobacteriovoraceae bacterium]|tara:strand:- start:41573 stop:42238 length:666 start_codon:yes stop_codon:yes gene_type:complete